MDKEELTSSEDEELESTQAELQAEEYAEDEPVRRRRKVRKRKRRIGDKDGEVKFAVDESNASPVTRRIILFCLGFMILGMLGAAVYMLTSKSGDGTVRESEQERLVRLQKEEQARISESLKEQPMDFERAMEYEVDIQMGNANDLLLIDSDDEAADTPADESEGEEAPN